MGQQEVQINRTDYVIIYVIVREDGHLTSGIYEESPGRPAIYSTESAARTASIDLQTFADNCKINIGVWIMQRAV